MINVLRVIEDWIKNMNTPMTLPRNGIHRIGNGLFLWLPSLEGLGVGVLEETIY